MITPSPYQPPNAASLPPQGGATALTPKQILFSFQGRIPRRTYWLWAILSAVAFMVVIGILGAILGQSEKTQGIFGVLAVILYIPLIWCSLALQIKRWHDRDKPGTWVLINLIPLVGGIWAFVEVGCLRGTFGPNNYGEDPT